MLPLIFFIVVGAWFVDGARLVVHEAPRGSALGQAALLLLFAYGGFENTPVAAGEFRNPQRDVPFALLVTVLCVTLLYSSVQAVALGTLPELATSSSPLAAAAARFSGHSGAVLLSVGALLSIIGLASNVTLSGPRYLFALSSDRYGPQWLARLHPTYRTPANAIGLQTAVVLALALSSGLVRVPRDALGDGAHCDLYRYRRCRAHIASASGRSSRCGAPATRRIDSKRRARPGGHAAGQRHTRRAAIDRRLR